jgi:crossover junction endodeoxyribonuclease RusA
MAILLNLPWPPSVNRSYRTVHGRIILSKVARDYRAAVVAQFKVEAPLEGRISMTMHVYCPDKRKRDLDGIVKQSWDALQAAGIIKDDSQIDKVYIERKAVEKPGRVLVTIEEI